MDTTADIRILRETVKKGEGMAEALAVVLEKSLALLVASKRGHQSFHGKWASDGRAITAEQTSSAVDLLSIKSGCCQLLIASNECGSHHMCLRLYLENLTSETKREMKW